MHRNDHSTPLGTANTAGATEKVLALLVGAACIGLIVYKFLLTTRLNVNWDEFLYLNNIYAQARGQLRLLFQGSYTHAFLWLTRWPGDELAQVVAGRFVMVGLLALSAALLWRLAGRWLHGLPRTMAVLAWLSTIAVITHGGSFRADSMLVPLLLGSLTLLLSGQPGAGRDLAAGILLGIAGAVTLKAALFAPVILAVMWWRDTPPGSTLRPQPLQRLRELVRVAGWAGAAAVAIIALHSISVDTVHTGGAADFGARSLRTTLGETPWFPRRDTLMGYVRWQPLPWLLIALGTVAALWKRRFDLAGLALALLPVAIYRNAYPYFFVVMLAPASILAGYAVQEVLQYTRRQRSKVLAPVAAVVVTIGLLYQGLTYAVRFNLDQQWIQQLVLDAVHDVFPEPVSYVDRCGMISSFPKVNFFMSTWGMQTYRERNRPFMATAIRDHRPAFVLVNTPYLNPALTRNKALLPEDQDAIARFYPEYWGPLRVAGASAPVGREVPVRMTVPFPASYRVWSQQPVLIDGVEHAHGDVVEVTTEGVSVLLAPSNDGNNEQTVRLFLASARPPPAADFPGVPIFTGL